MAVAPPSSKPSSRPRLVDVDQAKGLAILLIVIGHMFPASAPAGADWARTVIYGLGLFHRGFFVYLSGLVFFYTYPNISSPADYWQFVVRKLARFAPAYVLFAAINVMMRQAGAALGLVPLEVSNPWHDFLMLFYRPTHSSAFYLWYVYLLMGYAVLLPLLVNLLRGRLTLLVIVGFVVHFIPVTDWFMLNLLARYALYFALGGFLMQNYFTYTLLTDRWFGC